MCDPFDFVIIGSGFGGSVSALRLTEKGYRVLVLERGKRYRDQDFPKTNMQFWKYLWFPVIRCFGIMQMSFFRDVIALHGCGVGGGSLGYANVLEEPDERAFGEAGWHKLANWRELLHPHYATARRMLGVTRNPNLTPADHIMQEIAQQMGCGETFRATNVGVFFGEPNKIVPDPYFGGEGPERTGCNSCGGCMVGCRYNAKNTLVKNYLWFAERRGAQVQAECQVRDIRPLPDIQPDGARYEIVYTSPTRLIKHAQRVRAKNVIVSAGALGTLRLLFRCRETTHSLPQISQRLGDEVRTNSEVILGASSRSTATDYSQGIAITSIFHADAVTAVEPVRYSAGSDLMRIMATPMLAPRTSGGVTARNTFVAFLKSLWLQLTHPRAYLSSHWAARSTIVLVMQSRDTGIKLRWGRDVWTLWRRLLVSKRDEYKPLLNHIEIGEGVTRAFAKRVNGVPLGSFNESWLDTPLTAHLIGGVPFGCDANEGVIGLDAQVHNYPGLYVIDGSILPANPGVNPSLTITAFAEYMMSFIPANEKGKELPVTGEMHHAA